MRATIKCAQALKYKGYVPRAFFSDSGDGGGGSVTYSGGQASQGQGLYSDIINLVYFSLC